MNILGRWFLHLETVLAGWPDVAISVSLVGVAAALVLIAFYAPVRYKIIALLYAIFP